MQKFFPVVDVMILQLEYVNKFIGHQKRKITYVPIDMEGLSFAESLYEHLSLHHRLLKNQCLVLVQARSILSKEELLQLYKMASYEKWNLLLLEATQQERISEYEKYRLFDKDLCELILEE